MTSAKQLQAHGYEVLEFLGSGARSTIWQVRDPRTSRIYALKSVVKRHSSDSRFLEQAINEGQVGAYFNHPVIRRIYEIRRIKHWLRLREIHLLMEHCEGRTVQEDRPVSILKIVRIFGHVGKALMHMNAKGYVHADMKPNNIIVSPKGVVKIIDFGQSCRLGTIKERIQGTPDFIAPEQVRRRPLDARTDVFNFGASLYWTLTGKAIPTILPKQGSITMLSDLAVPPVERLNPQVPPALSKLVADTIEIHPSRRPGSMSDVISRLGLISYKLSRDAGKRIPSKEA
ncbi:MAG: serine/threonine-protein kinase [Planctomycetota bacterium]|jgi:serine/threonine-protein kinase